MHQSNPVPDETVHLRPVTSAAPPKVSMEHSMHLRSKSNPSTSMTTGMVEWSHNPTSVTPPPPSKLKPLALPNSDNNFKSQAVNLTSVVPTSNSSSPSSPSLQWHQPKVAATRNTVTTQSLHSAAVAVTPPNVSIISAGVVPSKINEKKEEKVKKEKTSFMKRLTKTSRRKSRSPTFSCDNPTFVDASPPNSSSSLAPVHVRSGSCPNETVQQPNHRKVYSFDDSNVVIKNSALKPNNKSNAPLTSERYRCFVPFPANPNSEYELELQVGDIVYVHRKREDGWFKGTLQRTGKTGLFPGSFVESIKY